MNVPSWIKLAAASQVEILEEVEKAIEELGGIDKAQEVLRQMASEKTSNWVLTERFIVSKSLSQTLDELDNATRKEWEDRKIVNKPVPENVEAPAETPAKEAPTPEAPTKTGPEKLPRGAYLAALLGIMMGANLSYQQLKNVDLKELLNQYKVAPKVPGKGKELAEEPLPVPPEEKEEVSETEELSANELLEREEEYKSQVKIREKEISNATEPTKKKDLEEDLKQFKDEHEQYLREMDPNARKLIQNIDKPVITPKQHPKEEVFKEVNEEMKKNTPAAPWSHNRALNPHK